MKKVLSQKLLFTTVPAVRPADRRQLAQWMVNAKAFSQRRACRVSGLARCSYDYQAKRRSDQPVEQAIEDITRRHPGWGFWRPPRGKFITACDGWERPSTTSGFGACTARWD